MGDGLVGEIQRGEGRTDARHIWVGRCGCGCRR